jgi:hypothetical protein
MISYTRAAADDEPFGVDLPHGSGVGAKNERFRRGRMGDDFRRLAIERNLTAKAEAQKVDYPDGAAAAVGHQAITAISDSLGRRARGRSPGCGGDEQATPGKKRPIGRGTRHFHHFTALQ